MLIFYFDSLESIKAPPTFAFPFRNKGRSLKGLLAQLVQSTCLTSRGSKVRILQGPRKSRFQLKPAFLFIKYSLQLPN